MKILAFGMNGFVGSRVAEMLSREHDFTFVSRSTGVDVTNEESVISQFSSSDAPVVFNFSAKANVDACEQDKVLGENGEAWKVNVNGVKNLVAACRRFNKKLLHISTDFVFAGEKEGYTETDEMKPINWYGISKAKADEIIMQSTIPYIILRPAFPYTFLKTPKHFVAAIYNRLVAKQSVAGVTDEIFTPTWIDDIAVVINLLLQKNMIGLYHVGGGSSVTPYQVSQQIAQTFGFDQTIISQTTREKYFVGKAQRPFNTSLKNDKIKTIGFQTTTFEKGLALIKENNL